MTQAELTEHFRRLIEYLERHEYLMWGLVVALFMGFMLLGSRASGWHKLATHYPCMNRYEGRWIMEKRAEGRWKAPEAGPAPKGLFQ